MGWACSLGGGPTPEPRVEMRQEPDQWALCPQPRALVLCHVRSDSRSLWSCVFLSKHTPARPLREGGGTTSARPATTGAVLAPCMNSQPRTSTGAWLTWTSTGATCASSPMWPRNEARLK